MSAQLIVACILVGSTDVLHLASAEYIMSAALFVVFRPVVFTYAVRNAIALDVGVLTANKTEVKNH